MTTLTNTEYSSNHAEPTFFFDYDGQSYALTLASNDLYTGEMDGLANLDFEVEQDFETEETKYVFDEFTITYSNGVVSFDA
tara:strand:- start:181 stop:423 length:243 start_codon:yes stop_codon:yes gene_type:complete